MQISTRHRAELLLFAAAAASGLAACDVQTRTQRHDQVLNHPSPADARPRTREHATLPATEYRIILDAPQSQNMRIEMKVRTLEAPFVDVAMPVWRPGRYEVLEQAGTVSRERATDAGGGPLALRKIDKSTWRINCDGTSELTFSYTVFANALANRTRHVDATHAFISPSAVLAYPVDRLVAPVRVSLSAPPHWRIASGLSRGDGEHVLVADDYDILADSPIEIGEHEAFSFDIDGVPHDIAIWSAGIPLKVDQEKVKTDFARVVSTQKAIFGRLPYDRYVFLIHAAEAGGGTEHLNSTIMQTSRRTFEDDAAYQRFLSLVSHEMFHTWNVKQMRPADLSPYDYAHENYTTLLWLVEGTTSYYDDLCLRRAQLTTQDKYLENISGQIHALLNHPGRLVQSLESSSFDSWIKFNRTQPDDVNTTIDFYSKGALVSLLLDLEIRRLTGDKASLDTIMRRLFERFPAGSPGYATSDILAEAQAASGGDFSKFHQEYIAGVSELEWADALAHVGLELAFVTPDDKDSTKESAWLGIDVSDRSGAATVSAVRVDGPAYTAGDGGINIGDQIIALNGIRVSAGEWSNLMKALRPGEGAALTLFRRDRLRTVLIQPVFRPIGTWKVRRIEQPTESQRLSLEAWLGRP